MNAALFVGQSAADMRLPPCYLYIRKTACYSGLHTHAHTHTYIYIHIIPINIYIYTYIHTSSTAQGGGGSFQNRKPIGEVGGCESRMAERSHWWIERWLVSPLFLSFSLSLFLWLSIYLSISLSRDLSISLSLSLCLSVCLQAWKRSYSARCLHFQSWQHQKRSNSARLREFLNLTTSKTKPFFETSSFFKLDNIRNKAILRDFVIFWT